MKTIVTFGLLFLVTSMVFGGMTSNVYAENNPSILLKIAERAQIQIQIQIPNDSSDKIKRLFEEGVQNVNALKKSLRSDDVSSAKEHFLSAMKIFKEISKQLTTDTTPKTEVTSIRNDARDPSNDLQRLHEYVNNLKTIAKKYDVQIDFLKVDELFLKARQQINDKQFSSASEILHKIKENVTEINKELRETASKQESYRAKEYAQKYLEQLDRLIENAKNQNVSDEIIEKLEIAKQNLSSAENPDEIAKEIRKIMSIKDQFKLTKNDRLESRILQVEKTLSRLSQIDRIEQDDLEVARNTLQSIKRYLYDGEFDTANQLLRDLAKQLQEIKNSL